MNKIERTKSPWPRRILCYVVLPVAVLLAWSFGMAALEERRDRRFAQEQRADIARGIAMTERGCPSVAYKIKEIGADGEYRRREIEVLASLITSEQAKPGGLKTCKAPSWRWFWGGWIVSEDYAN